MNEVLTLAVTSGEPAGVGPELCAALLDRGGRSRLVIVGDRGLLEGDCTASAPGAAWPNICPRRLQRVQGRWKCCMCPCERPRRQDDSTLSMALCTRYARPSDRRMSQWRIRGHGDRAGAWGIICDVGHSFQRAYRVSGRTHGHAAGGDDARRRGLRVALANAPAAARGGGCDHAVIAGNHPYPECRSRVALRHRRRHGFWLRASTLTQARRPHGARGNRGDRAGARAAPS